MKSRFRALGAALATCGLIAGVPATAAAAPTVAKLRVEAGGKAFDPGTSYVNDTARLATAPSECGGSGARRTVTGPSAIGLVDYAKRIRQSLRPFYASDKYSFGLIVCRIGAFGAFSASDAWLYKVNHKAPPVGGDQYPLSRGDQVLWYFASFPSGPNTGDELELRTPARVRPHQPFAVRAVAYDWDGNAKPAAGVQLSGSASAGTDATGAATVTASRPGTFRLRGRRANDIPAAPALTCVNANLARCPAVRGERIFGTSSPDAIPGTRGADTVLAGSGDDRVFVRSASVDAVSCGAGNDFVRAGPNDQVAPDCERVVRG
jgi:Ca2+-binding RTX toxin-like protein